MTAVLSLLSFIHIWTFSLFIVHNPSSEMEYTASVS